MNYYCFESTIGNLTLLEDEGFIQKILFDAETLNAELALNTVLENAFNEIEEYLRGKRKTFSFRYKLNAKGFNLSVYEILKSIEYGKTLTYKDIAVKLGNPNAARAVGNACNKNPLPIIFPCHRVVGVNGKLTGFAGGLDLKERLLTLEKSG